MSDPVHDLEVTKAELARLAARDEYAEQHADAPRNARRNAAAAVADFDPAVTPESSDGVAAAENASGVLALHEERASYGVRAQPDPVPSTHPPAVDLLIADLEERKRMGIAHYGIPLAGFNGRDQAADKFQEFLDFMVYFRAELYERDARLGVGQQHTAFTAWWRGWEGPRALAFCTLHHVARNAFEAGCRWMAEGRVHEEEQQDD